MRAVLVLLLLLAPVVAADALLVTGGGTETRWHALRLEGDGGRVWASATIRGAEDVVVRGFVLFDAQGDVLEADVFHWRLPDEKGHHTRYDLGVASADEDTYPRPEPPARAGWATGMGRPFEVPAGRSYLLLFTAGTIHSWDWRVRAEEGVASVADATGGARAFALRARDFHGTLSASSYGEEPFRTLGQDGGWHAVARSSATLSVEEGFLGVFSPSLGAGTATGPHGGVTSCTAQPCALFDHAAGPGAWRFDLAASAGVALMDPYVVGVDGRLPAP